MVFLSRRAKLDVSVSVTLAAAAAAGGSTKVEQLNKGWNALLSNIEFFFNDYKLVVALLKKSRGILKGIFGH